MNTEEEEEYTVEEAATYLGVQPNTVRRMLRRGQLRGYQLSRKSGWRIRVSDLKRFKEELFVTRHEDPPANPTNPARPIVDELNQILGSEEGQRGELGAAQVARFKALVLQLGELVEALPDDDEEEDTNKPTSGT